MLLKGNSRILELYYNAAWVAIGCLTDNNFNEELQTVGTTTRNSASWKTTVVTKQKYSINFTGVESDGVLSVNQLRELKRLRELVQWRIGSDTGNAYITNVGDANPAGEFSTFNGELIGYGTP